MDDADDLVERLLTLAGMIMEDTSSIAIMRGGEQTAGQRVAIIEAASMDIQVLAQAAEVVRRRCQQTE